MNVREMRKLLGMTQAELARSVSVDVVTVSRWENGKHNPSRLAKLKIQSLVHERSTAPVA